MPLEASPGRADTLSGEIRRCPVVRWHGFEDQSQDREEEDLLREEDKLDLMPSSCFPCTVRLALGL